MRPEWDLGGTCGAVPSLNPLMACIFLTVGRVRGRADVLRVTDEQMKSIRYGERAAVVAAARSVTESQAVSP